MNRARLSSIVLFAALAIACGGSEGVPNPAGPSAPTPPPVSAPTPAPTPSCAPSMPTNFRVDLVNSTRTFSWNPVANANDYFLLIGSNLGDSNILNTNTTQATYSWTGYPRGTYYARVYARNSCGSSPNAEIVTP